MSYEEVANRDLAAVVTFLEMRHPPGLQVPPSPLRLRQLRNVPLDDYRALFRRVGAPWLWFSRLILDDARLGEIIHHPSVALFAVEEDPGGGEIGILELDFRTEGECELAFVGLIPERAGQGHGRWLLAEALRQAWAPGIRRVHVHTCSLDHPAALSAYRRAGFVPFKRAIERFPDPRLLGFLPADAAPQVPLLGTPLSEVTPAPAA